MCPWEAGPSIFNGDDKDEVRFVLDNDVDHNQVLRPLQGHRLSVVVLPEHLRSKPDQDVRAWARETGRMIITHDSDQWYKRHFNAAENPGVIVIPRDHRGRVDVGLVGSVLNIMRGHRGLFDATVVEISADGNITLWNPDLDTGDIEPMSMRVRHDENMFLEMWVTDEGDLGVAPDDARADVWRK